MPQMWTATWDSIFRSVLLTSLTKKVFEKIQINFEFIQNRKRIEKFPDDVVLDIASTRQYRNWEFEKNFIWPILSYRRKLLYEFDIMGQKYPSY